MASLPSPALASGSAMSDEGRVIRVIIPPGSGLAFETGQMTVWKTQLKELGFARCVHSRCSTSFLSVKGAEAHVKTCRGFSSPGDYVVCPGCEERFKTFSTMAKHHVKAHGSVPRSAPVTNASKNEDVTTTPTRVLTIVADDEPTTEGSGGSLLESRDTLRLRILEESRQLSNIRPRGRPRKSDDGGSERDATHRLQFRDAFDVEERDDDDDEAVRYVQVQPMTEAFKNVASKEKDGPIQQLPPSDRQFLRMKTSDGRTVWVRKSPMPTVSTTAATTCSENLVEKVTKLANYQELVIKYEQLAEEATQLALEERTNQLLSYENELKRRELEAKRKLAGAVQVLQKIQSEKKQFYETGNDAVVGAVVSGNVAVDVDDQPFVVLPETSAASDTEEHLEIGLPDLSETAGAHQAVDEDDQDVQHVVETSDRVEAVVADPGDEVEDSQNEEASKETGSATEEPSLAAPPGTQPVAPVEPAVSVQNAVDVNQDSAEASSSTSSNVIRIPRAK